MECTLNTYKGTKLDIELMTDEPYGGVVPIVLKVVDDKDKNAMFRKVIKSIHKVSKNKNKVDNKKTVGIYLKNCDGIVEEIKIIIEYKIENKAVTSLSVNQL